jgi:hypothetical protein
MYGLRDGSGADGLGVLEQAAPALINVTNNIASPALVSVACLSAIKRNEPSVSTRQVDESIYRIGHPDESVACVRCLPSLLAIQLIQRHMMP